MTERKPPGMTWETWIDRQIRDAQARGEFADLSLHGKPLPGLDGPRDPDWWHKSLLAREGVAQVPATLRVRKELEESLEAIAASDTEEEVREIVAAINRRIYDVNRMASSGPPSNLVMLDVDRVLRTWAEGRSA